MNDRDRKIREFKARAELASAIEAAFRDGTVSFNLWPENVPDGFEALGWQSLGDNPTPQ